MRNSQLPQWAFLILVGLLSRLIYIPSLGFYWGDTFFVWMAHLLGAESMIPALSDDRPGSGVLFMITALLIGDSPLAWHITLLGMWLIAALLIWHILRTIAPQSGSTALVGAAIFIVYPGYLLHPQTVNLQNYTITLTLALFSIWLSIRAITTTSRWLHIPAMITAFCYLMILDIFAPLELLRFGLIAFVIMDRLKARPLHQITASFAPYLVSLLLVLVWRTLIFDSVRPETDLSSIIAIYRADFVGALSRAAQFWLNGVFQGFVSAWHAPLVDRIADAAHIWIILGFTLVGGISAALMTRRSSTADYPSPSSGLRLLALGILSAAAAIALPAFMMQSVDLFSANNRYLLSAVVGIGIASAGLWLLLSRAPLFRRALFAIMIAVGIGTQLANADRYARNWEFQRQMVWQLAARAPRIEPDTVLMAAWGYPADNTYDRGIAELFYTPNLFYHYDDRVFGLSGDVLTVEALDWIAQGYERVLIFRTNWYPYTLRYANSLIFSMPNAVSCLRVIDPVRQELPASFNSAQPNLDPILRERVAQVARFSHIDRIQTDALPVQPPAHIFGAPPDDWCQIFQRADLARQRGDWNAIASLYSPRFLLLDPSRQGFPSISPRDPSELLPFEEAFRMLERNADADAIRALIDSQS
ncbi:MAG: hypothetical protein CUN53_03690 [Phototrophicales bacterium]|nr:MAG: hypothetical protein CUN53_03690 [Phototrophicales bacterium]